MNYAEAKHRLLLHGVGTTDTDPKAKDSTGRGCKAQAEDFDAAAGKPEERGIVKTDAAATDADGSAVDQGLADGLRGLHKQATWN